MVLRIFRPLPPANVDSVKLRYVVTYLKFSEEGNLVGYDYLLAHALL
jgi:hypothetical protein